MFKNGGRWHGLTSVMGAEIGNSLSICGLPQRDRGRIALTMGNCGIKLDQGYTTTMLNYRHVV